MDGPTLNPSFTLSNKTRFTKKLFPVLYFPTIEIIPIFSSFIEFKKFLASSVKTKPVPPLNRINGIAISSLL